MSAIDTLRDALFGNPPSPTTEPSREGTLAAFTELYNQSVVAMAASAAGITTVSDIAARDVFFSDEANQGKLAYVNNNNGAADDPANGVYEYVAGAPRLAEGFYQGVAAVVQPLVDDAETAAATATTKAGEAADDAALVAPLVPAMNQIFSDETLPHWDSETFVASVAVPGAAPVTNAFNGFAQSITSGIGPFNVVRVPRLRRPADTANDRRWSKAIAIVRSAATNPHATSAPIVGLGIVDLDPDVNSYDNLDIYIRGTDGVSDYSTVTTVDPATVGVFCLRDDNSWAAMSRPTGSMSVGAAADSWYVATAAGVVDPRVGNWQAYVGDPSMGFELIYRDGLVDQRQVSDEFRESVLGYDPNAPSPLEILSAPPALYGVEGREMNLYFDNLIPANADDFGWDVEQGAQFGKQQNERWTWTPTGAVSASLDVGLSDLSTGKLLSSATIGLETAAALAAPVAWKLLVIGDSTTSAGIVTGELVTLAAADPNVTLDLIGTKGVAPNLYEATGGWTYGNWYQPAGGNIALNPFSNAGAVFSFAYGMANGLSAFSSPTHVIFNLGINDAFDQATDDLLLARAAEDIVKIEAMVASVHAYGAGIKVGVAAPIPPSASQDAFGDNYGVQYKARWRHKRNMLLYAQAIILAFGGRTAEKIWVVPINTAVDTVTGFPRASQTIKHSRIPVSGEVATYAALIGDLSPSDGAIYYATDAAKYMVKVGASTKGGWREATPDDGIVERANNGVHPVIAYKQIADVYWAWLHVAG